MFQRGHPELFPQYSVADSRYCPLRLSGAPGQVCHHGGHVGASSGLGVGGLRPDGRLRVRPPPTAHRPGAGGAPQRGPPAGGPRAQRRRGGRPPHHGRPSAPPATGRRAGGERHPGAAGPAGSGQVHRRPRRGAVARTRGRGGVGLGGAGPARPAPARPDAAPRVRGRAPGGRGRGRAGSSRRRTAPDHSYRSFGGGTGRDHAAPSLHPPHPRRSGPLPDRLLGPPGARRAVHRRSHRWPPLHPRAPRRLSVGRGDRRPRGPGHRPRHLPSGHRGHRRGAHHPFRALRGAGRHHGRVRPGRPGGGGGNHRSTGPRVGGGHRRPVRPDRPLHPRPLRLPGGGRPGHQLPPAPVQPAAAGRVLLRTPVAPSCTPRPSARTTGSCPSATPWWWAGPGRGRG